MSIGDVEDRLTRAEEQLSAHSKRSDEHHTDVLKAIETLTDATTKRLDAHDERLKSVEDRFTKYEGVWGFLTIVLSSLAAAWALFGDFIKAKAGFIK